MELEIDAKELLRHALSEVQPGEDVDEALLRVCKLRYPEAYAEVFPQILEMLELVTGNTGSSKLDMVRELVDSEGTMSLTMHSTEITETRSMVGAPGRLLDQLPPVLQAKLSEATSEHQLHERSDPRAERRSLGLKRYINCRCGYTGPAEDETRCPKCGREI